VYLGLESGSVVLAVEDDGVPFNPLQAQEVDIGTPPEERRVGGLGIHIVRNVMNELKYTRQDGRNRLVMRKRFAGGG
jgi:anti-sigma regulatory factor (Ser/Thr protein kinase)